MRLHLVLTGAALVFLTISAAKAEPVVKLTSLEWCPFNCPNDPEKGLGSIIVREAYRTVGMKVEIEFLPWLRAVEKAKTASDVSGYFLAYPEEVEAEFTASPVIMTSRLGLTFRQDSPVPPATVDGIKSLKIGTVSGYGNSKTLTAAISAGLKTDQSNDDLTNIRKLAAGRIDAIEIDELVLDHILRTETQLANARNTIAFKMPLEEKTLHIAFSKTPLGQQNSALFAKGLAALNVADIKKAYFAQRR